ncbi:phage tail sheath family protein (plasmid) [Vibrio cyclitrophicus]|uniref:phage tail sheath family protein n=2 Tax=Vibrio TaxID=662 RepID=UPI000C82FE71|nr:phage tail sheath C-terminal domain-containing protein [Vibrio cyclitrophicus]PMJ43426.1 phage tail protein [Vibrio cyclitrophicus]
MPITPSYPGVYIEELDGLSFSVSNTATAVPAFVADDIDTIFGNTNGDVLTIYSWLDYQNKAAYIPPEQTEEDAEVTLLTNTTEDGTEPQATGIEARRDACMRIYFENGGGRCYLVKKSALVQQIPLLQDVTLLVASGHAIQSEVATLCQDGKNLFAILDGPEVEVIDESWKVDYDTTAYAAVYYPWLKAKWSTFNLPPSAAIAGAYCANDGARGVWKAPANMTLRGGLLPIFKISDEIQGQYNSDKALNMIREFDVGSAVIWGARTTQDDDSWRYVPVRRLFNSAEKDIQNAMQSAMFEPNSQPTWEEVRSSINSYLYGLWKQGALSGATPEQAFFVSIGKDITMTEGDINQGKMIVKVGMAAVRPAEFIILQFTQDVNQ